MTTYKRGTYPPQNIQQFVKDTPTLHQLLDIGLTDLKEVEKQGRYRVFMHSWVTPDATGPKCCVCLAGSVMVTRLDALAFGLPTPLHFETRGMPDVALRLYCLDNMRKGLLRHAWGKFYPHTPYPFKQYNYIIEEYAIDRSKFFRDMHRMKRKLKAVEEIS